MDGVPGSGAVAGRAVVAAEAGMEVAGGVAVAVRFQDAVSKKENFKSKNAKK